MTFELFCMALIGLLFGLAVAFGGYRLFLVLLPIWGFFAGFVIGAQTVVAIFGDSFLANVTGWVVGFFVGLIFAVLSYLFYIFAVALLAFSAGYGATVGILDWIGLSDLDILVWIIAVVVGIVVALAVLRFNIQKYAVIIITAAGGTGAIIFVLLAVTGSTVDNLVADLLGSPVKTAIDNSPWWLLFFLVVAGAGAVFQIMANQSFEIETYNRYAAE